MFLFPQGFSFFFFCLFFFVEEVLAARVDFTSCFVSHASGKVRSHVSKNSSLLINLHPPDLTHSSRVQRDRRINMAAFWLPMSQHTHGFALKSRGEPHLLHFLGYLDLIPLRLSPSTSRCCETDQWSAQTESAESQTGNTKKSSVFQFLSALLLASKSTLI